MEDARAADDLGLGLAPGTDHYRAFVGPPQDYDLVAAMTFNLLTTAGLRQHHTLVDVGCGSLRVGRLLIPYLNVGNYIGIEPNKWLVEEATRREIGEDIVRIKVPKFIYKDVLDSTDAFSADYALAQSVFSHASLSQIRRWVEDVSLRLKNNGALFATFIIGNEDYSGDEWVYPDCVRYRVETMRHLAGKFGFRFSLLPWRHPRQSWAIFAKPGYDIWWTAEKPLSWNAKIEAGK